MSGWQDAVAGLQSQINTINSQISSLSGQEAANSSAISSLQTQVTAVHAQILSLQSQVTLGDIPASSLAVLNGLTAFGSFIQSVYGGDAVITLPVMDGKPFRVIVAGHVFLEVGQSAHIHPRLNNTIELSLASPAAAGGPRPFYITAECVWDSTTQRVVMLGESVSLDNGFNAIHLPIIQTAPLSTPTDFEIKIWVETDGPDSNGSVTITQFTVVPN